MYNIICCRKVTDIRESGGTGRRARLRGVWVIRTGSSPVSRTNKKGTFVYQKFLFCYPSRRLGISSAPKGWISSITASRYCISSRFSVYLSCGLMIYKAYALICLQKHISIHYIFCLLDLAKLYIGKHKSKIDITPTNMQPTF